MGKDKGAAEQRRGKMAECHGEVRVAQEIPRLTDRHSGMNTANFIKFGVSLSVMSEFLCPGHKQWQKSVPPASVAQLQLPPTKKAFEAPP